MYGTAICLTELDGLIDVQAYRINLLSMINSFELLVAVKHQDSTTIQMVNPAEIQLQFSSVNHCWIISESPCHSDCQHFLQQFNCQSICWSCLNVIWYGTTPLVTTVMPNPPQCSAWAKTLVWLYTKLWQDYEQHKHCHILRLKWLYHLLSFSSTTKHLSLSSLSSHHRWRRHMIDYKDGIWIDDQRGGGESWGEWIIHELQFKKVEQLQRWSNDSKKMGNLTNVLHCWIQVESLSESPLNPPQ